LVSFVFGFWYWGIMWVVKGKVRKENCGEVGWGEGGECRGADFWTLLKTRQKMRPK